MANNPKFDSELTKHFGTILVGAKGLGDRLTDLGLLDHDQLRLTVYGRVQKAKQLREAGLNNSQIAKLMEVDETTIRRDLRQNADQSRQNADSKKIDHQPVSVPNKTYGTIVIDPPWEMEKIQRKVDPYHNAFDYPTMTNQELAEFPVPTMAAEDCHLFCWTTHKHLPAAFELIELWGFKYIFLMTWHKAGGFQPFGLPQFNSEFVLYGRKGTPKFRELSAFNTCFQGERREHSRKPDEFYAVVRRVTEDGRIDIFSRQARDGFDSYGNETEKFTTAAE